MVIIPIIIFLIFIEFDLDAEEDLTDQVKIEDVNVEVKEATEEVEMEEIELEIPS